ncbi:hypothetical protein NDU88_004657, partial [Pleurodeles waltl]
PKQVCSRVVPDPAMQRCDDSREGHPGGTTTVTEEEEAAGNPEVWVSLNIKDRQPTCPTSGREDKEQNKDTRRRDAEPAQCEPRISDSAGYRSPVRYTDRHVPGGAFLRQVR